MAPSSTEEVVRVLEPKKQDTAPENGRHGAAGLDEAPALLTGHREPLKLSGALKQFEQFDLTPTIGKEFVDVDLAEWLRAPNSDELLRDLAITGKLYPQDSINNADLLYSFSAGCGVLPETR